MVAKKILVVDDSLVERQVLTDFLVSKGYLVVTADSGERAISVARQERPDLILMDVVMPGMNGYQATRTLSREDDTRHIPIIMCTSKSQETDRIWAMRQGAQDYIVKPLDHDALLVKIASFC